MRDLHSNDVETAAKLARDEAIDDAAFEYEPVLQCTHCGGDGDCMDGADPLDDCPDEPHRCHAVRRVGRPEGSGDLLMWNVVREPAHQLLPSLAGRIGVVPALLLQRVHGDHRRLDELMEGVPA